MQPNEVMRICRSLDPGKTNFNMMGETLQEVKEDKYLGVTLLLKSSIVYCCLILKIFSVHIHRAGRDCMKCGSEKAVVIARIKDPLCRYVITRASQRNRVEIQF